MGMYTASSLQLLCDLVNRDNPGLPKPFMPQNVALKGTPVAKAVNGRNTQATFVAKPGFGLQGTLTVYYDRINLTNLFQSRPLDVTVPRTAATVKDLLPIVNEKYGLNLQAEDITTPAAALTLLATPTAVTLTITAASFCFAGTLTVSYLPEPIGYYPNSGPGTKYLMAGNELYGYFGLVEQKELISIAELWLAAFPGATSITDTGFKWLKFFYNGKVVYLPTCLVGTTSWVSLYGKGLIFGTGDTGNPPSGTTPVEQLFYLTKTDSDKSHYFSLNVPFDGSQGLTSVLGLLVRLGDGVNAGAWGKETSIQYTNTVMFQQVSGSTILVGNLKGSGGSWIPSYQDTGWYPVLELLDPSQIVLPLADVETVLAWEARPLPVESINPEPSIKPLELNFFAEDQPIPVPTTSENIDVIIKPLFLLEPNVTTALPLAGYAEATGPGITPIEIGTPASVPTRPLAVTVDTAEPIIKTNLSALDGELNGFQ
ncbi:putative virion structural protein [Erwinia phage vB_EamM_Phobos]|uniref:virion structural protein n=1 Tax=Erwinia phage vB_EamM_Phobos TaxID=1883377 RepID=UPI00081CB0A8|nr:virion structural protein [Erwinia phage vB_EamM_Phobos]ANZ50339.1 putative virion structural protein [Erwinia phage vB_EamM_Phobos]